jgi:putative chitobiose transport system substrate-binding protein
LLLPLDDVVPDDVKDVYFPNLWDQQVVDDQHYMFPYYQGINVNLVNTKIISDAGLTVEDFPKTVQELPAFCRSSGRPAPYVISA